MSSPQEASLNTADQALTTGGTAFYRYGIWLLLLITLVSRLPYVAAEPYGWESFNFIMAVDGWHPGEDMPHFPGYLNHVLVLQALRLLIQGAALDVLHAASLLQTLLAIFLLHWFARGPLAERIGLNLQEAELFALLAAVLMAFNPLLWFYSEIGLSYSASAVISILGAWLVLWDKRSLWYWSIAAFFIGWMGGWRPESLLLIPLLVWGMKKDYARSSHMLTSLAALLIGILLWFLPAAIASGQGVEYLARGIRDFEIGRFHTTTRSLLYQLSHSGIYLLLAIGFAPVALLPRLHVLWAAWRDQDSYIRSFFLAWTILPVIALVVLFHDGYFLLLVPALTLIAALMLVFAARSSWQAWSATGVVLLLSLLWFTHPWQVYAITPPCTASSIKANDRNLGEWRDAIISLDPEGEAALVFFDGSYSSRAAMVDFPTLNTIQVRNISSANLQITIAQHERERTRIACPSPLPDSVFQGSNRLLVIGLAPDDSSQRGIVLTDLAGFSPSDSLRVGQEWIYVVRKVKDSLDIKL